jgi:hypothetical protein
MKIILLFLLLFSTLFIQACSSKKPEISEDRISRDIDGKTIQYKSSVLDLNKEDTWLFNSQKKLDVSNIRSKYEDDKAQITANVSNEYGFHPYEYAEYIVQGSGDVLLKYEWANNDCKLMKIINISFTYKKPEWWPF